MKTVIFFHSPFARFATLTLAITALFGVRSSLAQGGRADLVFTENSSTSLALSYTGGATPQSAFTVTNTGTDTWTITFDQTAGPISFNNFSNGWIEPENDAFVNEVSHLGNSETNTIFVHSDLSILQNTLTSLDNTSFLVGTDSAGIVVYLTFHDVAAANENGRVPESGSTLALFGLATIALCGLGHLRLSH